MSGTSGTSLSMRTWQITGVRSGNSPISDAANEVASRQTLSRFLNYRGNFVGTARKVNA
jgi:hypothetical protein